MRCLLVDSHCCDPTSRLPQTRFPLLTLRELFGFSGSRANRVLAAPIENGRAENGSVEKVLAMDGGPVAPGFRVTQFPRDAGVGQSVQPDNSSNWTTGAVHTDRTDTPNLARAVSGSDCRVPARGVHSKTGA